MEEFFKSYQYTFSALSSIGTLCAVLAALYFGYKAANSHKTKLEASIDIYNPYKTDINGKYEVDTKKEYLVVTITNIGLLPIEIPIMFCVFQSLGQNFSGPSLDADKQNYPVRIEPNSSKPFQIMTVESLNQMAAEISWIKRRFFKALILTNDGSNKKARLSKDIIKIIKRGDK